jgi:hypothetical protein
LSVLLLLAIVLSILLLLVIVLSILLLLAIVLSVLRLTASGYPFDICKLCYHQATLAFRRGTETQTSPELV